MPPNSVMGSGSVPSNGNPLQQQCSLSSVKESPNAEFEGRYFKLVVSHHLLSYLFIFVAPTNQEKEAWVTDIGQVSLMTCSLFWTCSLSFCCMPFQFEEIGFLVSGLFKVFVRTNKIFFKRLEKCIELF